MGDIVSGTGALEQMFGSMDGSSWLVLGGHTSFVSSGAERMLNRFLQSGARYRAVSGPLPTITTLEKMLGEIGADIPRGMLAVGGGRVMDTMKALALCLNTGLTPVELLEGAHNETEISISTVAAPTTAGSGAERTPFAVVYRGPVKHSLDDARILPQTAVLDPLLARSVPREQAAAAGLDAIAHCIESLWARSSTSASREIASRALGVLVENIEPAVIERSLDAIECLLYAASEAGSAIAITRTTAAHALSYHLTSEYGIPHGHAVALTLGPLFTLNSQPGAADGGQDSSAGVEEAISTACGALQLSDPSEGATFFRGLMGRLGLAATADEAAGCDIDRTRWLPAVNIDRLANNPRTLSENDLMAIMGAA